MGVLCGEPECLNRIMMPLRVRIAKHAHLSSLEQMPYELLNRRQGRECRSQIAARLQTFARSRETLSERRHICCKYLAIPSTWRYTGMLYGYHRSDR